MPFQQEYYILLFLFALCKRTSTVSGAYCWPGSALVWSGLCYRFPEWSGLGSVGTRAARTGCWWQRLLSSFWAVSRICSRKLYLFLKAAFRNAYSLVCLVFLSVSSTPLWCGRLLFIHKQSDFSFFTQEANPSKLRWGDMLGKNVTQEYMKYIQKSSFQLSLFSYAMVGHLVEPFNVKLHAGFTYLYNKYKRMQNMSHFPYFLWILSATDLYYLPLNKRKARRYQGKRPYINPGSHLISQWFIQV